MYVPAKHAVDDRVAWSIVREVGAGLLVAHTSEGLKSVFVPVVVSDDCATILTHVAKANPWWRPLHDGDEVLGLFLAASAYVSPSYYPTRFERPDVVPTWNYVAAEVRTTVRVHHDPEWLGRQVRLVTNQFEAGRSPEWKVDDSSPSYVAAQLKAIVGIELEVIDITGKAKLSQNRPEVDQDSVRDNLAQGSPSERNVAARMLNDG
jgi:transcriptional regulator